MQSKHKRTVAWICAAALAAASLTGCSQAEETVMDSTVVVDTQKAQVGAIALDGTYVGTVSAAETVNVIPLVSGTVEQVYVGVGSTVREGDKLCQFDDTGAKLTLASAQAGYNSAQAGAQSTLGGSWNLSSYQTQAGIETTQSALDGLNESLEDIKDTKDDMREARDAAKDLADKAQMASGAASAAYTMASDLATRYAVALAAAEFSVTVTEANRQALEDMGIVAEVGSVVSVPGSIATTEGLNLAVSLGAETATALQTELTAAKLTVENLGAAGLLALSNAADEAKAAFDKAYSAYTSLQASYDSVKANKQTVENQIESTQKQLETTQGVQSITNGQVYGDTVNSLQKSLDSAQVGVDSAAYQVSLYKITSPISGTVESVNVTPNNLFGSGSVAFTISNMDSKNVTFYVTEDVAKQLSGGQSVTVSRGGENFTGSISEIGTSVDPSKGLFKIKATLYNATGLSNGVSVSLSTTTHVESGCILVPSDSVYYRNGSAYVFVVQEGKAHEVTVETGIYNQDSTAIVSGLSVNDEVITTWSPNLIEGAPVVTGNGAEEQAEAASEPAEEADSAAESEDGAESAADSAAESGAE